MKPIEQAEVPATVHAVLAARIDRLPPAEKQLLQVAAVIGTDVPYPILAAIADEPEDGLRRGIAYLQGTEFLYEASLFPDPEYTFKHALTHEVAYGSLLQERRRALHARIAGVIETIHKDRVAEHVERLAHHAYRGEVWDHALVYLRQAGSKAVGRGALQEAVTCFEQAVATLDRLPPSPATLDAGIDLRLSVRNALYALGEHERTFAHLQAAERLAVERGDPRRLARVLRYISTHFVFVGDFLAGRAADAGRVAMQALDLARARGERGMEARALWLLGEITSRGDTPPDAEAAAEHYGQARALATELDMRPLVAHCNLGLGKLYRRTGDGGKAHEHLTAAATMYREMDMSFHLAPVEAELGSPHRNSP